MGTISRFSDQLPSSLRFSFNVVFLVAIIVISVRQLLVSLLHCYFIIVFLILAAFTEGPSAMCSHACPFFKRPVIAVALSPLATELHPLRQAE